MTRSTGFGVWVNYVGAAILIVFLAHGVAASIRLIWLTAELRQADA
jgi:hypothetical protein